MDPPLEDVAFLARSPHRVAVLATLADGPHDRDGLRATTGASAPTVGRILGDLEARGWVTREGHAYDLTKPGTFVAETFETLLSRMATERRVREAWEWLPAELAGFSVDLLADAVVTVAQPGDPYRPANRCATLYGATERVRGFDAALTAPHHFETLYQRIVDGLDAEIVMPTRISRSIAETYPEKAAEVLASGHLTLRLNDDLPMYRLLVFDERVGIGGYDPETGVLGAYVDTDDPAAREWVEATYERFRSASHPLAAGRPTDE